MNLLRNLGRRKLRTTLTILGITIGIWALVVFGSMANKIDALVAGEGDYYEDKVSVSAKGGFMGLGGPLDIEMADQIRALPGVDVVTPSVSVLVSENTTGVSMGMPPMISGAAAGADGGRETIPAQVAAGRALTTEDEGTDVTLLRSTLARQLRAEVGDTIELRGQPFRVVGILGPTFTAPDTNAMVPLAAAQRLYLGTLPPLVAAKLNPTEIATGIAVYPRPGVDPEEVGSAIRALMPDLATMTLADFDRQIGTSTSLLNAILIGIALISLVVGGLSVVNTMAMSITERTREIGIKRAIRGSRLRIVRELVAESAVMGLIGGSIGLALGAAVVLAANEAGQSSGTVLFDLTFGTAATALGFSTVLGAFAGFIPAVHAARLDPVAALRYE